MITLENSSFSNLAPNDFYFFPVLVSAFKRRSFFKATDINKNEAEELKRFLQNAFEECFQHLNSRWKKSIVSQWDKLK